MSTNNQPIVAKKGVSTLSRARFGPGMLLQHDDLEQLSVYTRELNRLMFRSLFGCGVVCGLVVKPQTKGESILTVTVTSGLALDCQGDPIHVPQEQTITVDLQCVADVKDEIWVVVCGTVKCCAPRASMCASDDDETTSACTREWDAFEIRLMRSAPKGCGCVKPDKKNPPPDDPCWCVNPQNECYRNHYAGECECCEGCGAGDCVVLARLVKAKAGREPGWTAAHEVRRFVRPVLMRDRQAWTEQQPKYDVAAETQTAGQASQAQSQSQAPARGQRRGG
jgi:hypothetical protein